MKPAGLGNTRILTDYAQKNYPDTDACTTGREGIVAYERICLIHRT